MLADTFSSLLFTIIILAIGALFGLPFQFGLLSVAGILLLSLSTTFLPRELITAKWLVTASWANPVTYVLEANRYLLGGIGIGWFVSVGGSRWQK